MNSGSLTVKDGVSDTNRLFKEDIPDDFLPACVGNVPACGNVNRVDLSIPVTDLCRRLLDTGNGCGGKGFANGSGGTPGKGSADGSGRKPGKGSANGSGGGTKERADLDFGTDRALDTDVRTGRWYWYVYVGNSMFFCKNFKNLR